MRSTETTISLLLYHNHSINAHLLLPQLLPRGHDRASLHVHGTSLVVPTERHVVIPGRHVGGTPPRQTIAQKRGECQEPDAKGIFLGVGCRQGYMTVTFFRYTIITNTAVPVHICT